MPVTLWRTGICTYAYTVDTAPAANVTPGLSVTNVDPEFSGSALLPLSESRRWKFSCTTEPSFGE